MAISHEIFASQAAYLASRCAGWAGECCGFPDTIGKPMRDDSIKRFLSMLRETADRIEAKHNGHA